MSVSTTTDFLTTDEFLAALEPYDRSEVDTIEEAETVYIARTKLEAKWVAWLAHEYAGGFTAEFQTRLYWSAREGLPTRSYREIEDNYVDLVKFAGDAVISAREKRSAEMF